MSFEAEGWSVRLAGEGDAEAVSNVLASSYPFLLPAAYDSAMLAASLPAMTRANLRLLASGRYFVVEGKDRLLACGGWSPEPPPGERKAPGLGHLRHFATRADWIGRGLGRAIYAACEAQCLASEIRTIEAVSTLNGEPFYRALGFAPYERGSTRIGGVLFPTIRMLKRLPA